jgi:hypothetical protein
VPEENDLEEAERILGEIERLEGAGVRGIVAKYQGQLILMQARAVRTLQASTERTADSADRYAGRLLFATWVLVALTVVILMLTVILAFQTFLVGNGGR